MLLICAIVLLMVWLVGILTSYTMGGFIHTFLATAMVIFWVNIITGLLLY